MLLPYDTFLGFPLNLEVVKIQIVLHENFTFIRISVPNIHIQFSDVRKFNGGLNLLAFKTLSRTLFHFCHQKCSSKLKGDFSHKHQIGLFSLLSFLLEFYGWKQKLIKVASYKKYTSNYITPTWLPSSSNLWIKKNMNNWKKENGIRRCFTCIIGLLTKRGQSIAAQQSFDSMIYLDFPSTDWLNSR